MWPVQHGQHLLHELWPAVSAVQPQHRAAPANRLRRRQTRTVATAAWPRQFAHRALRWRKPNLLRCDLVISLTWQRSFACAFITYILFFALRLRILPQLNIYIYLYPLPYAFLDLHYILHFVFLYTYDFVLKQPSVISKKNYYCCLSVLYACTRSLIVAIGYAQEISPELS